MDFVLVVLMAVGLSMDAFSLSLAYGTLSINKKDKFLLSLITGTFHFFMPLLGMATGNIIFNFIKINSDILVFIILLFIGLEMIISSFKEKEIKLMKFSEFFLFALAVSIDSFSVGITLTKSIAGVFFSPVIFSFVSFLFTYIGLFIGNKIARLLGKIAPIIGGIILIGVGITYIF
ncbi:MAG: manganese efflux pump [Bacilli bacterium]|nr:manganese efflux pump [Bacilli bacterium]